MDGFALAKIIRNNAIYAHIPIIFLTGNSAREYVATALAIDNSELLVKPLSHDQLLSAVGKYLHP
jgi:twitching motility two-component system response regulator PilG